MRLKYFILLFILIITGACMTVPRDIPEDLYPEEFFQLAQNAVVERGNYRAALVYYTEFINRFPDMKGKVIEAEYEIAFIHYKTGEYFESEKLFKELLAKYETEDSVYYPYWPKILSEKVLDRVFEQIKY